MTNNSKRNSHRLAIPAVTFSNQSVISNYPQEKHEAVDVTPALVVFAARALPIAQQNFRSAKIRERLALTASSGEASWKQNDGPRKAMKADRLGHIVNFLETLTRGKNANGWDGWIDRAEWLSIVESLQN